MALTSRKRYPNRVSRRRIPGVGAETDRPRRQEINVDSVTFPLNGASIHFDQPVSLAGIPQYVPNAGPGPTTAILDSSRTTLTLGGFTGTLTSLTVPFEDPAIRNVAGGFVRPQILVEI